MADLPSASAWLFSFGSRRYRPDIESICSTSVSDIRLMELSDGTDTRIVLCGRSHVEVADHRDDRAEYNETKRNQTKREEFWKRTLRHVDFERHYSFTGRYNASITRVILAHAPIKLSDETCSRCTMLELDASSRWYAIRVSPYVYFITSHLDRNNSSC